MRVHSEAVERYLEGIEKLHEIREKNKGKGSQEEDKLLDGTLDYWWTMLTPEERSMINKGLSH